MKPLLTLIVLALLGLHCNTPTPTLDDLARTYVKIALALGERDPDALDFYTGPQEVATAIHTSYPTLEQTLKDTAALTYNLQQLATHTDTEAQRRRFLLAQLAAVRTRIAMLQGTHIDFDIEAALLFQVTRQPDREAPTRQAALARLNQEIPVNRNQDLAIRYSTYAQHFLIPRDKLPAVMQAALTLCRNRTLEHLQLPPNEQVQIAYVRNKPWNAFSHYRGHAQSLIDINMDAPLTVDRALELACHEGYPGHHVFNTLRDAALAQEEAWPEAQVQLTFSPQSFVSEAAAAYAPTLAFTPAERANLYRDRLFPVAGLNPAQAERYAAITNDIAKLDTALPAVARDYLDGRLEFARAEQRLAAEALMEHSEDTLLYLNEYRTYMLAYTDGKRAVAAYVNRAEDPWQRYQKLMVGQVSPDQLNPSSK